VVVELLRQVSPLVSDEPEAITALFVRLDETYELGLVEDRIFITRILPLVSSNLMVFVGNCPREGRDWAACKATLLEEYFPYFVRERLVREMTVIKRSSHCGGTFKRSSEQQNSCNIGLRTSR
jgi:hypothetical protein